MLRRSSVAALVLGLVAGVGASLALGDEGSSAAVCRQDGDCALLTDGCCSCNEGGKQIAVPAKKKAARERQRKKDCQHTACPFVMSTDPSCSAKAVCRAGQCTLAPVGS